jgi:LysM repeat protein
MAAVITTTHTGRSVERLAPRPPLQVISGGRQAARARARAYRATRPLAPSVYRRRRVGAVLLVASLALVAYLAVAGLRVAVSRADATPAQVPGANAAVVTGAHVYVVQPGDTLWSIARSLHPHGDLRVVVDRLEARTGGANLQPGQQVSIDGLTS